MTLRQCVIIMTFFLVVTSAWNAFWDFLIVRMESDESIANVVDGFDYGLVALMVGLLIIGLIGRASSNVRPSSTNERLAFITVNLVAVALCYLLWIWIKVPEEAGSPALSVMSVYGWGIVALPAYFLICAVGLHLLPRKKNQPR